jgi:hypothetical protein
MYVALTLLRPLILAAAIVPIFLDKVATHGGGLTVELAGVAVGLAGLSLPLRLRRRRRIPAQPPHMLV